MSVKLGKLFGLKRKSRADRKLLSDQALIASSGLFDERWYLRTYPDVATFGASALEHFVRYGAAERRAAGPHFNTDAYLRANPDVATSTANALVHYLQQGAQEGRSLEPSGSALSDDGPATFSLILADGDAHQTAKTLASVSRLFGAKVELISAPLSPASRNVVRETIEGKKPAALPFIEMASDGDFLRSAIRAANNAYIVLVEPGDVLSAHSLLRIAAFLHHHQADVVYSDEVQISSDDGRPFATSKPFWSPDLLASCNYFGRLTAIRRSIALTALPVAEIESHGLPLVAAEWDLNLRVTQCTQSIRNLPEVLCRRARVRQIDSRTSTQGNVSSARVLEAYWDREGHSASIAQAPDGTFHATWPLDHHPLVSVIIEGDDANVLRQCAEAVRDRTAYRAVEIIVIGNNTLAQNASDLHWHFGNRLIKTISLPNRVSKAHAWNKAVSFAQGELLLFLSSVTEINEDTWIDDLVRQAIRPGIGVVTAQPLDREGYRPLGCAFGLPEPSGLDRYEAIPVERRLFGTIDTQSNQVIASGSCHILRRQLFELVNGYDETCTIDGADVLLCLAVARMGFRSVYLPSVKLKHGRGAGSTAGAVKPSASWATSVRSLGMSQVPRILLNIDVSDLGPAHRGSCRWSGFQLARIDLDRTAAPPAEPIDVYDLGAVALAAKQSWAELAWPFDPSALRPSLESGVQILLQFLAFRPDLRKRYRQPIGAGRSGEFARWVKTEGLRGLGLGEEHRTWIDEAFSADLGALPRKILLYDDGLRREQPLFLLSPGRPAVCERLADAVRYGNLTREAMWWFLFESAETQQTALSETWADSPSWQARHPAGGTIFGIGPLARWASELEGASDDGLFVQDDPTLMSDVAQVRLAYATTQSWQQRFPEAMTDESQAERLLEHLTTRSSGLPFLPRRWSSERRHGPLARNLVRPGVNVLGHFSYPSGLRVSAESLVAGLHANGVTTSLRNVPVNAETDEPIGHRFRGFEIYDTTIIHVQPEPFFDQVYERSGLLPRRPSTYRVGFWYWELDEVPSSWDRAAQQCDEFWAATEFIADGLRKRYRQPVHVLMPGIELGPFDRKPRSFFGIPDDAFIFLFAFHMTSVMDRKNPLGLIEAFIRSFANEPRATLVIKTTFGNRHPDALDELRRAAESANIVIIDEVYSRDQTLGLMAACDAYVSLHRSEGLGLTMAEAMLLGKPVIATGYSGNLDFMTENNSLLVKHHLVSIDRAMPPYALGQRWAEPSTEHAAELMRQLFDDRALANRLGERAKLDMERDFTFNLKGTAMAARLAAIAEIK